MCSPLDFQPGEHGFRIRKGDRVPFEVAPVLGPHPETVEMEDVQRDVALAHAVDKAVDRLLVVFGGERGGQPQAEGPRRRQSRAAGQPGVAVEHVFRRRSVDQKIGQRLALDRETDLRDELGADLEGDPIGLVDQGAPAPVGQEEGNVLVGLFGRRAAVAIPDLDRLTVAGEGGEALAKPVNQLADAEVESLEDVGLAVIGVDGVAARAERAAGDALAGAQHFEPPILALLDAHAEIAARKADEVRLVDDDRLDRRIGEQFESRAAIDSAAVMLDADADDVRRRGRQTDGEIDGLLILETAAIGT
jgi:hypothetical protein